MNVIQLIVAGIPQPPSLIECETAAQDKYCELAKECGVKYDFDDVTAIDESIDDLITEVTKQLEGTKYLLMWWDIDVKSIDENEE